MKTKQQIQAVMAGLRAALISRPDHDETDQRVAFAMESVLNWVISKSTRGHYVDDETYISNAVEIAKINAMFIRRDFRSKQ